MSDTGIVDASVVICLLRREPGWQRAAEVLPAARICAVNLAEVVSKLSNDGSPEELIRKVISELQLGVAPFDADLAIAAGLLRGPTRHLGLSLGDRACLALAMREGAVALTADRAWLSIPDIRVELIRP